MNVKYASVTEKTVQNHENEMNALSGLWEWPSPAWKVSQTQAAPSSSGKGKILEEDEDWPSSIWPPQAESQQWEPQPVAK